MPDHNDARFAASEFAASLPKLAESPEPATTGFRAAMLETRIEALLKSQEMLVESTKALIDDLALFRGPQHRVIVTARRLVQIVEQTQW